MAKLIAGAWLCSLILFGVLPILPVHAAGSTIVSVAALGVQGEGLPGVVNYILVQLDHVAAQNGPTVQFSEINLGGGSRVGDEWKEGVRRAVQAVTRSVGDPGHDWLITIKNRSVTSVTDGMSASAAVAVAIMAAYHGTTVGSSVVLSGQVLPDGRIDVVGGLPVKIEAAASAHYSTVVVPRDQNLLQDWTIATEVAQRRRVQLIQVGTLEEAYQAMTTR